jgi:N-acyl-D-amino-acid deacylase
MKAKTKLIVAVMALLTGACTAPPTEYDMLIVNGTIYDGSGNAPMQGAVGINADTIAYIGDGKNVTGKTTLDAGGQAVSPGFINMLSWATESLISDPRGLSDIKQGVTLEVMGEGGSMGPYKNPRVMKNPRPEGPDSLSWTTLGQYLQMLEDIGVSPNVASFVGATTLRVHEVGYQNRPPSAEEMENMKRLARQAMEEGALGIGSSLIYAPAFYASTEELIELCKVAAEYGGMYITHMRSEGNRFLEAIDETIRIAAEAGLPAEIYHLKAGGTDNWPKMDLAIAKIDSARNAGIKITTDMYNYAAGSTGLNATMPPWAQEGGYSGWVKNMSDPAIRAKIKAEMYTNTNAWENFFYSAGPDNILLVGFDNPTLREKYTGKTLRQAAEMMGVDPADAAMNLVIEDGSRVGAVYFLMSEDNVKKIMQLPYMSFGSDAGAVAAEGETLQSMTHPRTYGNFARLLGKYVRDEKVLTLEEAIRKLTSLPAENLKIDRRGMLRPGFYADVVVFDPNTIQDHATFEAPHQYSTGVTHVLVNGRQVLKDGEHTGAKPGKFVKGLGWKN